jgi:GNAT superfamily N-acetyltransferase
MSKTSPDTHLRVLPLRERPEFIPELQAWFEAEWPGYYGHGGPGDARRDLLAYAQPDPASLPLGLLALRRDADGLSEHPCGFAAIKTETFAPCPDLGPWAGAALVPQALRRQGIGLLLLRALVSEARALYRHRARHPTLFCATATSDSLMLRAGWRLRERVMHGGGEVRVYEVDLA